MLSTTNLIVVRDKNEHYLGIIVKPSVCPAPTVTSYESASVLNPSLFFTKYRKVFFLCALSISSQYKSVRELQLVAVTILSKASELVIFLQCYCMRWNCPNITRPLLYREKAWPIFTFSQHLSYTCTTEEKQFARFSVTYQLSSHNSGQSIHLGVNDFVPNVN